MQFLRSMGQERASPCISKGNVEMGHDWPEFPYMASRCYFPGRGQLAESELEDCDGSMLAFLNSLFP